MEHYTAVGLMSGSSLDGLDIALVHLTVEAGRWHYEWIDTACIPYPEEWHDKLATAHQLDVPQFLQLHTAYGAFTGAAVAAFLRKSGKNVRPDLIASHGHTVYHNPAARTSTQVGDGAAIAAATGIATITDLRNADVALGGQGAPIVPVGDRLLFNEYDYLLNLGGIANISIREENAYTAFDVCPCNQLLDYYAQAAGKAYDANGELAASGTPDSDVLERLAALPFYGQPAPRSLANTFSREAVLPVIDAAALSTQDSMATAVAHIAAQIDKSLGHHHGGKLLVTGGGAFNGYLVSQLSALLAVRGISVVMPDARLASFKEALVMALIGALRIRGEANVYASVTGASRDSIGGAIWAGRP